MATTADPETPAVKDRLVHRAMVVDRDRMVYRALPDCQAATANEDSAAVAIIARRLDSLRDIRYRWCERRYAKILSMIL
jgi:hypothetical protein